MIEYLLLFNSKQMKPKKTSQKEVITRELYHYKRNRKLVSCKLPSRIRNSNGMRWPAQNLLAQAVIKKLHNKKSEIISVKVTPILFQNTMVQMILINQITPMVRYEKLKLENHFFEMLTATVSHDMRTPLNAIIGLSSAILSYIQDQ